MATSNTMILQTLNEMAKDIATIKEVIKPLPDIFRDMYIGNGEPPLRDTCREYLADKKAAATAKKDCEADKKDDKKWGKRLLYGGVVGLLITQFGLILFAYLKLLPFFDAIR
jgi:hypothetical protein